MHSLLLLGSLLSTVTHGWWFWDKSPVDGLKQHLCGGRFKLLLVIHEDFKAPPVTPDSYPYTPFEYFLKTLPYASECDNCDKLPIIFNQKKVKIQMIDDELAMVDPIVNYWNEAPPDWVSNMMQGRGPHYLYNTTGVWSGSNGYLYTDETYVLAMMGEKPIQGTVENLYESGGMVAGLVLNHYWETSRQKGSKFQGLTTIMFTMSNSDDDTHFWYGHFLENFVSLLIINEKPNDILTTKTKVLGMQDGKVLAIALTESLTGYTLMDGTQKDQFERRLKPTANFVLAPASFDEKDPLGRSAEKFMGDPSTIDSFTPFEYPCLHENPKGGWTLFNFDFVNRTLLNLEVGYRPKDKAFQRDIPFDEVAAKNLAYGGEGDFGVCNDWNLRGLQLKHKAGDSAAISMCLGVCGDEKMDIPDKSFDAQFTCPHGYIIEGFMTSHDRRSTEFGIRGARLYCVPGSTKH